MIDNVGSSYRHRWKRPKVERIYVFLGC